LRAAGRSGHDTEVMAFRTTLMSPFLLEEARDAKDYIDLFLEELLDLLCKTRTVVDGRAGSPLTA
jgi:hypothetical protein